MNSRRLMPPQERDIVAVQRSILEGAEVRSGSKADMPAPGLRRLLLPPKADIQSV